MICRVYPGKSGRELAVGSAPVPALHHAIAAAASLKLPTSASLDSVLICGTAVYISDASSSSSGSQSTLAPAAETSSALSLESRDLYRI